MTTGISNAADGSRPALHPAADVRARNIICVASGKGGVGKTWLAITLSHALARSGARTLLFDGDLGLANVDVQLGLMPERDLDNVVAGHIPLPEAVTHFDPGGFDIIAGRSGAGALAAIDQSRLTALRNDLLALARGYGPVVLDLGAGVDNTVRLLADLAGTLLVVATDEPTALTDAYAFIKLMAAKNRDANFGIVVNMAGSARDGERTYAKLLRACEGFLKLSPKLVGVVRRDEKVRDCIRHQTPLLVRHPNSDAASDVTAMSQRLGLGSY